MKSARSTTSASTRRTSTRTSAPKPSSRPSRPPHPPPPTPAAPGRAAPAGRWPDQLTDKGLGLPAGKPGVYGIVGVDRPSYVAPPVPPLTMGATVHDTAFSLLAGLGYGATPEVTVGGQWEVPIYGAGGVVPHAGFVAAYLGYRITKDPKLEVVLGGDLGLSFAGGTNVVLHAGAAVRYKFAPKFSVYTGAPVAPGASGRQLVLR